MDVKYIFAGRVAYTDLSTAGDALTLQQLRYTAEKKKQKKKKEEATAAEAEQGSTTIVERRQTGRTHRASH